MRTHQTTPRAIILRDPFFAITDLNIDFVYSYKWNPFFNLRDLIEHIKRSNRNEITGWLETDLTGRLETHGLVWTDPAQRMTYSPDMDGLLDSINDIRIPLFLPCDLAAHLNGVVNQGQAEAHLPLKDVLKPASANCDYSHGEDEGLYMWSVDSDLMWQQTDRRIDE